MPTCKLENCSVGRDGRCLEGQGAACPNLIPETEISESDEETTKVTERSNSGSSSFEALPSVAPLEVVDARTIARSGRCMVIVLTGMPKCGKTSLLARLHQMFQAGPVGSFDFAGSRSLPHFEERNWLATVESGETEPRMERSSSQFDNSFLHLAVRSSDDGTRTELLFNDITGETCERAVQVQSNCENLIGLARADHLVVLVDGEALALHSGRYQQIEHVRDFVQRTLQSHQCGKRTALHIVTSKLDKLKGHEDIADKMESDLNLAFQGRMGSVNLWRIAARPRDGSLPTSDRIGELFAFWVQTTHRYPPIGQVQLTREGWARDFCRYGL